MPKEDLAVEDGRIIGSDGTATSYWELADETVLDRPASGGARPKPESDYRVVGTDVARIDLPDKLAGRPRYVHDLQFDDMVYGRVVRPPSRGATLTALDTGPTLALPGVVTVVRDGDFLGVIAEREEVALRAAERLRADATWDQDAVAARRGRPVGVPDGSAGRHHGPCGRVTVSCDAAAVVVGDLPSAVHRARVDRTVMRGRDGTRRRTADLVAQPERAQPAPGDRARVGNAHASNWSSATSRAPGATATTAPTTPQWTRRCSRWPCRAARCRWCGRGPTSWRGRHWEPLVWSGSRPTPRQAAPCCPGGTRSGAAASSAVRA